jgi:hypothetical protein
MDPLTALSVAGTIVQFIDFSTKLFSLTIQFYQSSTGTLKANDELDLVALDIAAITAKLSLGKDLDPNFQKLCALATDVANEISARLDKLKVTGKHRAWKSLRQAINAAWAKDELAALLARLSTLRETLETNILMSLR